MGLKIWFLSDTHCLHKNLRVPDCDLVIHCGDEAHQPNPTVNLLESLQFFEWFSKLPMPKIFVPGNHSTAIYHKLLLPEQFPEVQFLIHREVEHEGLRIFGSPWTPTFGANHWAYIRDRGKLEKVWNTIPEDTDILVTHGPPKGVMDLAYNVERWVDEIGQQKWKFTDEIVQTGCKALWNRVSRIKPRIHAFGHIHRNSGLLNNGVLFQNGTCFVNCSCIADSTSLPYKSGYVLELSGKQIKNIEEV